jgi:hypothetical protein
VFVDREPELADPRIDQLAGYNVVVASGDGLLYALKATTCTRDLEAASCCWLAHAQTLLPAI